MTTKYDNLKNDIKKYITNKFKEIEDYNNELKDLILKDLCNNTNEISYSNIKDKINNTYNDIILIMMDFNSLNNKLK